MPVDVLLDFNGNGAYDEMGKVFEEVINDLCQTILANAQANLGGQYEEVATTLRAQLVRLAQTGMVEGQVGSDHWEAWIAEWGSGSEMDTSNPDLAAYMASEYWNPVRDGFAITGRPKGPYLGLDNRMHDTHTGKLAGVNLEELSRSDSEFQAWMARVGLPPDAFQPKPPLHFMREALEANRNLIMDQLNAVIETFRFGDFFV
jgi:hypothetical protein